MNELKRVENQGEDTNLYAIEMELKDWICISEGIQELLKKENKKIINRKKKCVKENLFFCDMLVGKIVLAQIRLVRKGVKA